MPDKRKGASAKYTTGGDLGFDVELWFAADLAQQQIQFQFNDETTKFLHSDSAFVTVNPSKRRQIPPS